MDDAHRRAIGLPVTDHAVYTDKCGEIIVALINAYTATGDDALRAAAVDAASALLSSRVTPDGWMLQAKATPTVGQDNRMRALAAEQRPFLAAQAWFGSALLSLYGVTGDAHWLKHAQRIADAMQATLWDARTGGFFATVADASANVVPLRKPLEANARAAHFLYDLSVYTQDKRYQDQAVATIHGAAAPEAVEREGKITGELALALEQLTNAYVEFTVVGDASDDRARALFLASARTYHPRKLLHYEAPGRYPDRGRPALYLCNPDVCSQPIEDPTQVAVQAQIMRAPATTLSIQ